MKLGANQLMLLKMAEIKGYVSLHDVRRVYGMTNPRDIYSARRQRERQMLILKKLELAGLLCSAEENKFILTEKGKRMLEEIAEGDMHV